MLDFFKWLLGSLASHYSICSSLRCRCRMSLMSAVGVLTWTPRCMDSKGGGTPDLGTPVPIKGFDAAPGQPASTAIFAIVTSSCMLQGMLPFLPRFWHASAMFLPHFWPRLCHTSTMALTRFAGHDIATILIATICGRICHDSATTLYDIGRGRTPKRRFCTQL